MTKKVTMKKKIYCVICGKYRKFKKPKISYIFEKTLDFSVTCSKCQNEDEKTQKEEESIEILKTLGLIKSIYLLQNMSKENIIQEFRLKNIDQTKNYFVEEIEKNELMSRKYKMFCALDYIR